MAKEIKLLLGGEERTLKFGTNKLLDYAGEIFDGDPMELIYGINTVEILKMNADTAGQVFTGIGNPKRMFQLILAYAYGALLCAGSTATKEEITAWIADADFTIGKLILSEGRKAFLSDEQPGEAKAQTNQEQASE